MLSRVNLSVAVVAMTTNKTHRLPNGTTTEVSRQKLTKSKTQNLPKGSSHIKKTGKKGDIVPFGRPPPLNGSKGDICCLITDKSA